MIVPVFGEEPRINSLDSSASLRAYRDLIQNDLVGAQVRSAGRTSDQPFTGVRQVGSRQNHIASPALPVPSVLDLGSILGII